MTTETIGILHPGEMGISLAAVALRAGHQVCYASNGRSARTQARAREHRLRDVRTVPELVGTCGVIISICPPHAATDVADAVAAEGFRGLYVDANAISPQRAVDIGRAIESRGGSFVDGGIIGGPASEEGGTRLYLSGKEAERVRDCFTSGRLEVSIIGDEIGKASALKMCYAAYSKGTTALLAAIMALAEVSGVREDLLRQWDEDEQGFARRAEQRTRRVTAKAWRFAGEMVEIAATFRAAGLPDGFHAAAGAIYRRMQSFKDVEPTPALAEVISKLLL